MSDEQLAAIDILAKCMAYVAMADGALEDSEKALMVATLSKWVRPGVMDKADLQVVAGDAFKCAKTMPFETYTKAIKGQLTKAQVLSIAANVLDLILSDGKVREGELNALRTFTTALEIKDEDFDALRVVFLLKNNVDLFLDATHRWNEPDYEFPIQATTRSGFDR